MHAVTAEALASSAAVIDDPLELDSFTQWEPAGHDGRRVAASSLRLAGMHCAACAGTIEHALRQVPGVIDASVSASSQCAGVRWDPASTRASALIRAVEAAGYEAFPDTRAAARLARQRESRTALWRLFVAAFCAMQIMMLAAPAYVSAAGDLPPDQKRLLDWGSWLLTLPVLWFSAAPFLAGAWNSFRHRRIGMDVPVAIGIVAAFVASSGAAFDPGGVFGREVWFDSLSMFIAFLLGGRCLEMRMRHRAEQALEASVGALPDGVLRVHAGGRTETVSLRRLAVGDVVRVPVGQAFPADGVLTEGETAADESLLTGESRPVRKGPRASVVAGSINLLAPVQMSIERLGADTRYEAIVALMNGVRSQRPALLSGAQRWAAPFLWAVLLLAAGAGAAWSLIDPGRAVWVVVSVLIVTCPCALSLAAPSALLAAAAAMGRRGVLLRRLDAIEGLAHMQTLFIDKTGTLTEREIDCVETVRLTAADGMSDATLRSIAASLAGYSTHPLAAALARPHPATPITWKGVHEAAGLGLEGWDADGHRWRLGGPAWIGLPESEAEGVRTGIARDGLPLAYFVFDERLRADAVRAVRSLQDDGVRVHLLSGDERGRVRRIAAEAGIASSDGALAPAQKLEAVRQAQARGETVGMLGDGINDAPVLAQADVSLAMGEGALIARSQADGVLTSNRLADLVHARRLSRRALRVVRQNLVWAAAYNAACVPLALVGWLPPWAAGAGMAASSLFVVMNSMRLAR